MKKDVLRVNELAEQIGAEFKLGEPLSVVGLTASKKDLVAEVLTKSMDIDGVEVCFDAHRDKFVWTISDECHYGPDALVLQLEYGWDLFDYDEEGYLLNPFRVLDGKDIHKVYGFDSYGNRSYCVPVVLTEAMSTTDNRYYDGIAVQPETSLYASSLLYIVEWGGANREVVETIDYESLTLPDKANQKIFVHRVQSHGGKQGIDYYVLPTCYSENPILRGIVEQRDNQYETKMKAGEEQFAHKVNLVSDINKKLKLIKETSNLTKMDFQLAELKASDAAQAYYVDELKINDSFINLLLTLRTLDESFQSLKEKHDTLKKTKRLCHRAVNFALNQMKRWEAASPYFEGFNQRINDLGGAMIVDLYKVSIKLPSMHNAGQYFEEAYLIDRIQLPMLDKKIKEYEDKATDNTTAK